jgi:ketosteroid isomerase-like protein
MNSRYRRSIRSRQYCVHYGPSGNQKTADTAANGKEAFTFASDTTKQLIALTSAIIAVTVTFAKDIFAIAPGVSKVALVVAWLGYITSLVFGVFTLMALTGEISSSPAVKTAASAPAAEKPPKADASSAAAKPKKAKETGIWSSSVTTLSAVQILVFLVATGVIVVCGLGFAYGEYAKNSDRNVIKNLAPEITNALRSADVKKLEQVLAADSHFSGANGASFTKAQLIADLSAKRLVVDEIQTETFKTESTGDTATETGFLRAGGQYDGKRFSGNFRYTILYSKRNDKWKAVFLQTPSFQ